MRILFVDFSALRFNVDTPYHAPLGGTQSALCYLAAALTPEDDVTMLSHTDAPGMVRGVRCIDWDDPAVESIAAERFDVAVLIQSARGMAMRRALGSQMKLVLWTGDAAGTHTVEPLFEEEERGAFDAFVFVSDWQRDGFCDRYKIDRARTQVIRYGVSPGFENLFTPGESIMAAKASPPVLAYTSTPFRGLDVLLRVFPSIRRRVPGIRLKVFSSMKVYGVPTADDEAHYAAWYRLAREMEGVEHVGSIPQTKLALAMRDVTMLAYPSTYAETACIAAMEAMAAGCHVVTTNLGALKETAAGFAHLVEPETDPLELAKSFGRKVIEVLNAQNEMPAECETHLRRQVDFANAEYSWKGRAAAWRQWLRGRID